MPDTDTVKTPEERALLREFAMDALAEWVGAEFEAGTSEQMVLAQMMAEFQQRMADKA